MRSIRVASLLCITPWECGTRAGFINIKRQGENVSPLTTSFPDRSISISYFAAAVHLYHRAMKAPRQAVHLFDIPSFNFSAGLMPALCCIK
jgi:hypothetical protein